ncbi:YidB family protein [Microvirga rosea]|uniref:YidB family protein n=1 Tax=Microvirga rosea TaxID=2715425 RepID=UPI001D0B2259|nr:YidB family protein [Microvirga rosea]MCB8821449.1 YidB family protein [Microvirga rosea]
MGLLDAILGYMMGAGSSSMQGRGGTTSPIVKALMMLLAAKAYQHYRSGPQGGPLGGGLDGQTGRGLGGMLGQDGGLGGLLGGLLGSGGGLGGGGLGGGGLGGLFDQFRQNGYGDHVDSWVGTGQNRQIAPAELSQVLGSDTLDELEQRTGVPRQELLSELSQELPDAVDQFTPEGRLPTEQEASSRWV